jgi:hypothetical protein
MAAAFTGRAVNAGFKIVFRFHFFFLEAFADRQGVIGNKKSDAKP